MSEIFDELTAFLIEEEWPFQVVTEGETLTTQFRGDSNQWPCYVQVDNEAKQLAFYSASPTLVPTIKLGVMAEYITRANYGLVMGNFELNYDGGQLRFKTSLDVEDAVITGALIKNVVYANVTLMNLYLPGALKVIYSDKSPKEIIEEIEGDDED